MITKYLMNHIKVISKRKIAAIALVTLFLMITLYSGENLNEINKSNLSNKEGLGIPMVNTILCTPIPIVKIDRIPSMCFLNLNKSIYDPFNHNELIIGTSGFIGSYIGNQTIFHCQNSIVSITPSFNVDKFVSFNNVYSLNLTSPGNDYQVINSPYISSVAIDQFNKNIYISSARLSNVSVFNSTTCNITSSTYVGSNPINITIDQQTGYIYVVNENSNNISIINPRTEKVTGSIVVGISPSGAIYDPLNHMLYVSNSGSNDISVINTRLNTVIATINVGKDPKGMIFVPQNKMLYVNNENSQCISVINTTYNDVIKIIKLGSPLFNSPCNMVYYAGTGSIYTLGRGSNVTVINTSKNSITASVNICESYYNRNIYYKQLNRLSIDFSNSSLILSNYSCGATVDIDLFTNQIIGGIPNSGAFISHFNKISLSFLYVNNPNYNQEYIIANTASGAICIYSLSLKTPSSAPIHQTNILLTTVLVMIPPTVVGSIIGGVLIRDQKRSKKRIKSKQSP